MKKFLRNFLIVFILSVTVAFVAAWNILPEIILKPARFSRQRLTEIFPHGLDPQAYGMDSEEFDITSFDGTNLEGLLIHSSTESQGIVIMLHGIGAYKEVFFHLAKKISSEGFMVVLTDLRAMGQSGGEYCTYGFLEKKDIEKITEQLTFRYPELPIAVYGCSLGGAIAIQSMADNVMIDAGIIECTYDDIRKVVRGYTANKLGIEMNMAADFALWRASCIAGFEPDSMNPSEYAAKIQQPIFIAHGDQDTNIPISWGKINFDNIPSDQKTFYEITGAAHHNIATIGGEAYSKAVLQFLKTHLRGNKTE
jgi:alpha-beta hydrolase superfamily lysophospholipase